MRHRLVLLPPLLNMLMLLTKITVCFFILFLVGCSTVVRSSDLWAIPAKPSLGIVEFIPIAEALTNQGGLYISTNNVGQLQKNIETMELYSKQLRDTLKSMARYYGIRIEEW